MTLSPKQQEIHDREELLLDVAQRMLLERGYEELRMDKVAEAIGVSKGTVYQHFGSRDDLLAAYGVTDVFSAAAEKALAEQWHRLAVAGVDEEGRQIMWIHGGGTQPDEEHACIWASTLYFFAVHADLVSLRNVFLVGMGLELLVGLAMLGFRDDCALEPAARTLTSTAAGSVPTAAAPAAALQAAQPVTRGGGVRALPLCAGRGVRRARPGVRLGGGPRP